MSERPPATPRRRGHAKARFRKACHSRFSAYSPAIQRHSPSARTCFEGPFAEVLRSTGPMANVNPFRFSTKYQDEETGLLYYGFRYLGDGRWLSRDPLLADESFKWGADEAAFLQLVSTFPSNGRKPLRFRSKQVAKCYRPARFNLLIRM
jgi:RHS repeat-associated protein